MSIAEKLTTIAENTPKVYEQGKADEEKAWWDMIEHKDRTLHTNAYYGWGAEYIRPPKKIVFINSGDTNSTFAHCINLKKVEKKYFDFSNKPTGTTSTTGYYYTFYNDGNLEEIEDIGLIAQMNYSYAFHNDKKLHTIAKLGANKNTTFGQTFTRCEALKNIAFSDDSQIGKSISFLYSPLTLASAISVITHLFNYKGTDEEYINSCTFSLKTWEYLDADEGIEVNGIKYSWRDYIEFIGWGY